MQQLSKGTLLQGGKYRIEQTLGQGGFGITYLALQNNLGRHVAIKEFFMKEYCQRDGETTIVHTVATAATETVTRSREKFIKEARKIAQLNHPNIVRVIDVFEENETAYYVMDYAAGGSLSQLLKTRGPLPEAQAVNYVKTVAGTLGHIHSYKMTHLDVKPANIMLDEKGNPLLIDFGLSKQYDSTTEAPTSSMLLGISKGYAPTEQYDQGGVDRFSPESDIYALAATLYKLLTGVTPPSSLQVREEGLPIEPLQSHGVRPSIIALLRRVMESPRRERINNANAFSEALTAAVAPAPAAPAPQHPAQMQRTATPAAPRPKQPAPAKKSSVLLILCSFVAVAVIGAVGLFVYLDYQNSHSNDDGTAQSTSYDKDADDYDAKKSNHDDETNYNSSQTDYNSTRTEYSDRQDDNYANDNNQYSNTQAQQFSSGTFYGKVNGKYNVVMEISRSGQRLSGYYYYESTMSKKGNVPATYISLNGYIDAEGYFRITSEFYNDNTQEQWNGRIVGNRLEATSYGDKPSMTMEAEM